MASIAPFPEDSNSRAEFARAQRIIAGGVDSPVRAGKPMGAPGCVVAAAKGSHVVDADGRSYVDYLCAYGPVLLGHAHPAIAHAVRAAAAGGLVFGATHPEETRLAERIASHIPSMERLRFVSTGTEACMSAVRVARAFTRRQKIVRFAGNYHGHSDAMIFSAGASSLGTPGIESGITAGVAQDVLVLHYNDGSTLENLLRREGDRIAAVILEPVCCNMGLVLPDAGYLSALCGLCRTHGAVSIFDEVITGFRLGLGGAQALYAVQPDVTCIGKALGGGLPIAAFGGRADIMAALAPEGRAFQGGTFSGNPLCVSAAHAFLDVLEDDPAVYKRMEALAVRLAQGMREVLQDAAANYAVTQLASIVDFKFRSGPAHRNFQQALQADEKAYAGFYRAMLEQGIFLAPSQMEVMFLTAAHTEADIDATVAAMRRALGHDALC